MNEIDTLKKQIKSLVDYMRIKIDQADWHAVADAAMDIRELEAKIKVYESYSVDKNVDILPGAINLIRGSNGNY